jgi:hypothetical protein
MCVAWGPKAGSLQVFSGACTSRTGVEGVAVLLLQLVRHARRACGLTLRRSTKLQCRFVVPCLLEESVGLARNSAVASAYFWDIASCSPLEVNRRFGGTY